MSLSGGQIVRRMFQNLKFVGPRFIQCCCSMGAQVDSPAILWTPGVTPDCCGSTPAQPASASTPWTFRVPFDGSRFFGLTLTEVSRSGSHGGSVVEVVDGVDVDVETGADAEVEVDEEVVVEVDVGKE